MYYLINKYRQQIIDEISRQKFINKYEGLLSDLKEEKSGRFINVAHNLDFQRRYKSFWAMGPARLSVEFYEVYFSMLEENKNNQQLDLKYICEELYEIPADKKEKKSIQFSFATKLIHMINPHKPIYDRLVRNFYFIPEPDPASKMEKAYPKRLFERRLPEYMAIYNFLIAEYRRVIENELLNESIRDFRNQLKPRIMSDEKIIDTLIWGFVVLANKGYFLKGQFEHF